MRLSRTSAYHEAGHAVAALMVGYHVIGLSAVPDPVAGRRGYIEARGNGSADEYMADDLTREVALRAIFYSGAGSAAQSRYSHEALGLTWLFGGVSGDLAQSTPWAAIFHPEPAAARSAVFSVWAATASLVTRGGAWRAIVAVAEALFMSGELDGRAVETASGSAWPAMPELVLAELPQLRGLLGAPFS